VCGSRAEWRGAKGARGGGRCGEEERSIINEGASVLLGLPFISSKARLKSKANKAESLFLHSRNRLIRSIILGLL
jgi:hypothetical protein